MKSRALPLLAIAALVLLAPEALACSVCFDANAERRGAFLATTLFLTLTPLSLVLGTVWWLSRRARALDAIPPAE
ncbi:MAG: hypothetical protein IT382_06420 [Deltaproteobacteria bacterium]|nr:hypothetical protein [Deltaproteobacteria bacterium]